MAERRKKKIMGCGVRKHKSRFVLVQEIYIKVGQGEMSWPTECLLDKQENLDVHCRTHKKTWVHQHDPSITEAETGESQQEECAATLRSVLLEYSERWPW